MKFKLGFQTFSCKINPKFNLRNFRTAKQYKNKYTQKLHTVDLHF